MLMREATTAIDCVTRLARLELATVEIGLRLWRRWIDVGGTLAEDLNRIALATPRSVAGPALGGSDTALQAAFRRFFGQLSQVPFQVAMQFLLEASAFLAGPRTQGDTARANVISATDHVRAASDILARTGFSQVSEESAARTLAQLARDLDEIRVRLQRLPESPSRARGADPDACGPTDTAA
jgi:hypothetical protein